MPPVLNVSSRSDLVLRDAYYPVLVRNVVTCRHSKAAGESFNQMPCITPCILNGNAPTDRGIPPPNFLYRIVRSPTAYRSVALHLEERNVYRNSEFVKEFPVLCDMRADYRGGGTKRKAKYGTDHLNPFSSPS